MMTRSGLRTLSSLPAPRGTSPHGQGQFALSDRLGGAREKDLLDAYPNLTEADLRAAMIYAADALAHEETV